jgi:hypothetical protein
MSVSLQHGNKYWPARKRTNSLEADARAPDNRMKVGVRGQVTIPKEIRTRKYRRQGGSRSRILADFLMGAHAQTQANRLLSRDRGFYGKLFPSLQVVDPSRVRE